MEENKNNEKDSELVKKKKYKPTKLSLLVNMHNISPVTANWILLEMKNSGDVEAKMESIKAFIDDAKLYGIKNDILLEGTFNLTDQQYKEMVELEEKLIKKLEQY